MEALQEKKDEELVRHTVESAARVRNAVVERARRNLALNNTIRKGATYDLNATFTLPLQEYERKSGILEKLSSSGDNTWVPVIVILSEDLLCFSPLSKLQLADCIPMNEVLDVCAFDDSLEISLKPFESGPAWSNTFNNLNRLTGWNSSEINFPFAIYTVEKGYNGNRTYFLRAKTEEERLAWLSIIADLACHFYRAEVTNRSKFRQIRFLGRKFYNTDFVQQLVASLIFLNFLTNCLDAQFQPGDGSLERTVFQILDIAFTAIFAFELTVNLFLYWFWPFWTGSDWYWNVFDSVVVVFSVLALGVAQNSNANILRTIRAFRVIRVFRRLKTLNLLMLAFYQSATPVLSCMFILFLVICIFGILGVDLFSSADEGLFGTFLSAVFTMFQVSTLDSWAQNLARITAAANPSMNASLHFYFSSFAVIGGMVLMNVIFAVLLDEFSRAYETEKSKTIKAEERTDAHHELTWPLDPLMETFLRFENEIELQAMIAKVFQLCDTNSVGWVDYPRMKNGLKMLQYESVIHLAREEYDYLARYYTRKTFFNLNNFREMIHHQLLLYCNRCLTRRHQLNSAAQQRVIFNAMKMLTLQVAKISKQTSLDEPKLSAGKNALKIHRINTFESLQSALLKMEDEVGEKFQIIDFMLKNMPRSKARIHPAEPQQPEEAVNPVDLHKDLDATDFRSVSSQESQSTNAKNSHASSSNPVENPPDITRHEENDRKPVKHVFLGDFAPVAEEESQRSTTTEASGETPATKSQTYVARKAPQDGLAGIWMALSQAPRLPFVRGEAPRNRLSIRRAAEVTNAPDRSTDSEDMAML